MQIAIDTSTSRPVLALLDGLTPLFDWRGPSGPFHGETLLAGLDEGLKKVGRELKAAEFVSVGVGPGTFTGLRIGVVMAKFLADSHDIPVAAVSSLHAQALSALGRSELSPQSRVWSLTDARRQEVYALCLAAGELRADKKISPEMESALRPESLAELLEKDDWLLGEGAENYRTHWPTARIAGEDWRYLQAQNIGIIGKHCFDRGEALSAAEVQARYLKTEKF